MKLKEVEEKRKGKIKYTAPDGRIIEVDIDTGTVTITKEEPKHKSVFVTFLSPDGTFTDDKGKKWKVVEE